jgi:type II secretory pathway pseudopilin PulG
MKVASERDWKQGGFTILELIVATATFLLVAGAAFTLLINAQQRYQTDSQILNSFQEARLGLDQIVRDLNDSGYPPLNHFSPAATPPLSFYQNVAVTPIAWSPGYGGVPSGAPCSIGLTCTSPGDFDLIVETNLNPQSGNSVSWVRYQLPGGSTTLLRGVVPKSTSTDPVAALPAAVMLPYVQNVVNNAGNAQIAAMQAIYPTMFPGGLPVPIFSYMCDTNGGASPVACSTAGAFNTPANVRDVEVTLIVKAPIPDAQSGKLRLVELHGRGRRVNPNR